MPLVVEIGAGAARDAAQVGGKALGLERLMSASLPCPPAFCVTTGALEAYLDRGELRSRLAALLAEAPDARALRALRTIAFEEELPAELSAALAEATGRLRAQLPELELLAVRSSAADEDGDSHSFAGLHETELGIPLGGVEAAVRKCWASLWSEGSIAYRREHGLPLGEASMAVVVQALVPAEASAVVFTANPMSGSPDEVVVHATRGLGPTLVDNEITPDTAVLAKDGLALKQLEIGDKHLRIDPRPAGGVVRSQSNGDAPAVSEDEFRELAELALEVERRLGTPVDVEAAYSGHWHLIQARPITTLREAAPA
jgi:phosphoenolpyruvate synthase/pyruvate phosphate dikinase